MSFSLYCSFTRGCVARLQPCHVNPCPWDRHQRGGFLCRRKFLRRFCPPGERAKVIVEAVVLLNLMTTNMLDWIVAAACAVRISSRSNDAVYTWALGPGAFDLWPAS